jgi:hypothetical protein
LLALYGGPDQVMTVTSGLASLLGPLLLSEQGRRIFSGRQVQPLWAPAAVDAEGNSKGTRVQVRACAESHRHQFDEMNPHCGSDAGTR